MHSIIKLGGFLIATCALGIPAALGQAGQCCMGMPRYDASTETKISGTVQEVVQPQRGRMDGIHLMVKAESGIIEVHLGPASFIAREGFSFAKGDAVEITGSKVTINGAEVVIAREVVKDGKTLTLRDKTGRPMWAGRRT